MREDVYKEFGKQAYAPPANDKYIAAFFRAVLLRIDSNKESEMIRIISQEHRRDRTPSHIANIAIRAAQHQLLEKIPHYPTTFEQPETWAEQMDAIDGNRDCLELLQRDIEYRTVQSNITERYKAFKLVASMMVDRFDDPPRIIDIGCSRNLGLKKLRTGLPFGAIELDTTRPESDTIDTETVAKMQRFLNNELCIGPSKGVDIEPLDIHDRSWPRSCSFYPAELHNTATVEEYDYLDSTEIEGVEFMQANIINETETIHEVSRYDIATASTFLYMLNDDERQRARSAMRALAKPNGVIVYQDFVRPKDASSMQFEDNWFNEPYLYRTLVEYANDPQHRCYEAIRWETGRCKKWIPGKDFTLLLENATALHAVE